MDSYHHIVRTDLEIGSLVNQCVEAGDKGSRYPGMSYEEGILAAIRWLTETDVEHPLEEG